MARPAVSVVVPFAGDEAQARRTAAAFGALDLAPGDELLLADNTVDGILSRVDLPAAAEVVRARGEGSPARARNAGALAASCPWILFVDADCVPPADLLDRFLGDPVADDVGLLAGEVVDAEQDALTARYSADRGLLDQRIGLRAEPRAWAFTANLLVRREVWRGLGGFLEGIFNGEDVDFCWRAQDAGWRIELREGAAVAHAHRETVGQVVRQARIWRASAMWVHRRWPEAQRPPLRLLRRLVRPAVAAPLFAVRGQRERAAFQLLDAGRAIGAARGVFDANRARPHPRPPAGRRAVHLYCDEFPVVSETFIVAEARELAALGHALTVHAGRRPAVPMLGVQDLDVRWAEDETRWERLAAMARLAVRRPLACARDLRARRAWEHEEGVPRLRDLAPRALAALETPGVHLHAHFAAGAALAAMRVAALTGRPWSLVCHGYDVFKMPRNLRAKARAADLVIVPCESFARHLREVAGPDRADRVHVVVMGVDPDRFRRAAPHPEARTVVAVGRLVEKKGFGDLVRAAADPRLSGLLDRVVIVGEGPEADALRRDIADGGLGDVVELRGRAEPDEVRGLLEDAAVLAAPCVVAADGDRDSMPVVVKEAMAMEIPVVVTAVEGLPEIVTPECGRVVAPGDPAALAGALAELLAMDAAGRAALGRQGRARVRERADVRRETARLSALLGPQGTR